MATLHFTLSPQATQKVHEALLCLSKFSEFVSLEARGNQLCLSVLNSTKSAYGAVHLSANRFCEDYRFVPVEGVDRFTCRLQVKALLAVFRQRYLDSKDKSTSISRCEVRLSNGVSSTALALPECRLLIRLMCNHGVLKTYKLTYEEVDIMHAIFDQASAPQRWRINSALLKEYMEHFGPKAEQLDVSSSAGNGRAAFTSFTEKLIDGKEILKQPLQTSVALDTADFELFEVEDGLHVALSLKDFKAITMHAASLEVPVETWYSRPGKPMLVEYARDGMEVKFTLMTAPDGRGTQNFSGMGRIVTVQKRMEEAPAGSPRSRQQGGTAPRQQSEMGETAVQYGQGTPGLGAVGDEADDSLYRVPTQQLSNTGPIDQPLVPPPSARLSPPPPVPIKEETVDVPLFLNYSSDSTEDNVNDLGRSLDDERGTFMLGWDASGGHTSTTVIPVASPTARMVVDGDENTDVEESGVGPTQQSAPPPRGLFD